ncbi:hypothetical protein [Neisseria meningitidis]|uniref:hypothetical protein n=1 Tax=Neisseria meningitidis TaxID=487 RepID=UPI00163F68FC|nr:hypothetical protein [Neisseria meningitidis]
MPSEPDWIQTAFCMAGLIVNEQKSGQGDEAVDSTNSTEPIHFVLQHLRESFSLS